MDRPIAEDDVIDAPLNIVEIGPISGQFIQLAKSPLELSVFIRDNRSPARIEAIALSSSDT